MTLPRMISAIKSKLEFSDYFKTSLAHFYVSPAHRWLVYTVLFIFSGLGAFGALWIYDIYCGYDVYGIMPLPFKGMYAWHTAANFAVCFLSIDFLIGYVWRSWGAYDQRTVRRTWVVFLSAFPIGFILQRTLIYKLVDLYYPKWILRHELYPAERPGAFAMFIFMLVFWLVIGHLVIRFMQSMQERSEELLRVRIDTILEERAHQDPAGFQATVDAAEAEDHLHLSLDSETGPIRRSQIGHITAEDHYLRVYFHIDGKCKETLIRMSLKELTFRLPVDQFIRIHRSHIVNLKWISGVKRAGREVRLALKYGDFDLPVSRYRLPQLLPALGQFLDRHQYDRGDP